MYNENQKVEEAIPARPRYKHENIYYAANKLIEVRNHAMNLLAKINGSESNIDAASRIEKGDVPSLLDVLKNTPIELENEYIELHAILDDIESLLFNNE